MTFEWWPKVIFEKPQLIKYERGDIYSWIAILNFISGRSLNFAHYSYALGCLAFQKDVLLLFKGLKKFDYTNYLQKK